MPAFSTHLAELGRVSTPASSGWQDVVDLERCQNAKAFAIRLRSQNLTWRVLARGACGDEILASGVIPSGDEAVTRVEGLPDGTLAAVRLTVQAAVTTGSDPVEVRCEVTWEPIQPGAQVVRAGVTE